MISKSNECLICSNLASNASTCSHLICYDCKRAHLETKIDDLCSYITCPAHSCTRMIDPDEAEIYLDYPYQTRLQRNINISRVAEEPWKYKLCPECEHLCRRDMDEIQIVCTCGHSFCFECGHKYCNDKHVCERVKIESIVDEDNENMKLCPRCNIIIERVEGCDAVKCTYCKVRFCWSCMRLIQHIDDMKHHKALCTEFNSFASVDDTDGEYDPETSGE